MRERGESMDKESMTIMSGIFSKVAGRVQGVEEAGTNRSGGDSVSYHRGGGANGGLCFGIRS